MNDPAPPHRTFDPERHDSHVIALFHDAAGADAARSAVVGAGVPDGAAVVMADGDALHQGVRHPVQDLFVPEDDYHDFHHALGRGRALLIVRPETAGQRVAAVAALRGSEPLDLGQHGRRWRGVAEPAGREINHANLSRADMRGRAIGGRDEVVLDMTGQKMTVRSLSEADMAAAPFAPPQTSEQRPAPLAPAAPARDTPVRGTSYTYGVPMDVVRRMTPEQQVMAQPHSVAVPGDKTTQGTFLRVVDGQTRVGWRDTHPDAPLVRSYVTERPAS